MSLERPDYVVCIGGPHHGRVLYVEGRGRNWQLARPHPGTAMQVDEYTLERVEAIYGGLRLSGHALKWTEMQADFEAAALGMLLASLLPNSRRAAR